MANWWLKFNSADDAVHLTNTSHFEPNLSDFSYSIWFKYYINSYISFKDFLRGAEGDETGFPAFIISIINTTQLQAVIQEYSGPNDAAAGPVDITEGMLYNATVTCDRDNVTGLNLYINGTLVGTANPTYFQTTDLILEVDENVRGLREFRVDQVRFYKGVILTPTQIQAIYNGGAGAKVVEADIVALSPETAWYAELDEGTGNPTGRYFNGSTWSDSTMTLTGDIVWESGGVPFDMEGAAMDDLELIWAW